MESASCDIMRLPRELLAVDRLPHVAAGRLPCRRRLSRLLRRGRLRRRLVVLPAERPPTVRRR
jgi:hypothetical protein